MSQEQAWLPTAELRGRGVAALIRELGPSNALRFLSLYHDGEGDYTRDRARWLRDVASDDLEALVDEPESTSP